MRRVRAAGVIALALTITAAADPAATGIRFDFKVPSLAGGTIGSEDLKGRIAVVDVWATWCGPCRMVIPHLVRLQDKYKSKGVTVVGLNTDDDGMTPEGKENVRRFAREYGIDYPIGLMTPQAYVELARVMGFNMEEGFSIPTTLILGRNGMVIQRYPGYFQGQEQEIEKVIAGVLKSEEASQKKP